MYSPLANKEVMIMRKYLTIFLLFIMGEALTGQTLKDISIVDSETTYFLTLTFDNMPSYTTSEIFEPPSFTINFSGVKWKKGDFARRVMTDPLYQYSIKSVVTSLGREDLEMRLDFFSNTEVKINQSGNNKIIVSWDKFQDSVMEQSDLEEIDFKELSVQDALRQIVSLQFRNADIQDVVSLLTTSYGLNVIVHKSLLDTSAVSLVSLSLKDVSVQTAMDVILKINGYDWYLDGEIIVAKPASEVYQGELVTKIYELRFADATIVADALANGILSQKGSSIGFSTGIESSFNNRLMISDSRTNIPAIENFIESLDIKTKQIHISVKFIETTLSADEALGINWGLRAELKGPSQVDTTGVAKDFGIDFPGWEALSMAQLSLPVYTSVLQILTTDNESKLLQEPQVTTFDNSPATIVVGTNIPILVPQASGGILGVNPYTFEDTNVDISLQVTPRITEGLVSLAIDAQIQAIIGYVGPDADRPVVSTRSTETNVRVADGRTLLIGGLILNDESLAVDKVPFLGNLPLIGFIFKNSVKRTSQRELLIFITPSIVS